MVEAPGYYGKTPVVGDFVRRRVPAAFGGPWDSWLATLVSHSRAALGPAWEAAWMEMPVWYFATAGGVPGGPMRGVLIPSVDRVGRCFPFTVFGGCGAPGDPQAWDHACAHLALGALEDGFTLAALDAALQALGPPPLQPIAPGISLWRCEAFAFAEPRFPPPSRAGEMVLGSERPERWGEQAEQAHDPAADAKTKGQQEQ